MLQDISPRVYDSAFRFQDPRDGDLIFLFHREKTLMMGEGLPTYAAVRDAFPELLGQEPVYLFSVDDLALYLILVEELPQKEGFSPREVQSFRTLEPGWLSFAGITAAHLGQWYDNNRICGRCGTPNHHSMTERAMCCPACGLIQYPKINPVVIVGVIDGDRLLMTRYAQGGYRRHALIAGFCEIGETLEDTVRREVMEEVGLKVKNIRYHMSQPWGFSGSLIAGFHADLDGDPTIHLDENELAEAVWVPREEIPTDMSTISITYELIEAFREQRMRL